MNWKKKLEEITGNKPVSKQTMGDMLNKFKSMLNPDQASDAEVKKAVAKTNSIADLDDLIEEFTAKIQIFIDAKKTEIEILESFKTEIGQLKQATHQIVKQYVDDTPLGEEDNELK